MANNNIEKYLEAMLAVLNGDNPPAVPTPSWNIEKYLTAILTSLENGGGGGQLPTPTAQDVGKVATVVEETSKGAVIVPEQSVTVSGNGGAVLSNANISLFTVGTYCAVTINGTDYSGTVGERKGTPMLAISLGVGHGEALFGAINGDLLLVAESGTYTVSVNVISTLVSYGLSAPSGALVLTESVNPNHSNYMNLSESFDTINAALIEGKSVILKSGNYVQGTIVGTYEDMYESGGQATTQYNVIATVVDATNGSSQSLLWANTHSNKNPSRKITS